jgi:hypothetical protein
MDNREAARERRQESTIGHSGSSVLQEFSRSDLSDEGLTKALRGGPTDLGFYPSRSMQKIEGTDDKTPPHDGQFDMSPSMILQPNRRTKDGDVELGNVITDAALSRHNTMLRKSNVNHLVHNWRSPLGK